MKPREFFNVVAEQGDSRHRLIKVHFQRDGSVFVYFPGFTLTNGLLGIVRSTRMSSEDVNLAEGPFSRITSNMVKLAHHSDGEAHFSQTGKVLTEVRRKSVPLDRQTGHLFTVQFQNISTLKRVDKTQDEEERLLLESNVHAFKLVAARYPLHSINIGGGVGMETSTLVKYPDGRIRSTLAAIPPAGYRFDDVVLLLRIESIPPLTSDRSSQLICLAGFDPPEVTLNPAKHTEFLVFAYPSSDHVSLRKRIRSIDLTKL